MKLAQVRKLALSLEGATEAPHHAFSSFRTGGRIFVTVPPDEQHIHVFVAEDERERALALHPEFAEKLSWGGKVVGLRIHLPPAAPDAVEHLVRSAHAAKAAGRATRTAARRRVGATARR